MKCNLLVSRPSHVWKTSSFRSFQIIDLEHLLLVVCLFIQNMKSIILTRIDTDDMVIVLQIILIDLNAYACMWIGCSKHYIHITTNWFGFHSCIMLASFFLARRHNKRVKHKTALTEKKDHDSMKFYTNFFRLYILLVQIRSTLIQMKLHYTDFRKRKTIILFVVRMNLWEK